MSSARRVSAHRRSMDPEFELFIFLSIIRRGFQQLDLAYRIGLSQPTVSRIFNTWLRVVHDQLVQVPIWLPQADVRQRAPEWIKKEFPRMRIILGLH